MLVLVVRETLKTVNILNKEGSDPPPPPVYWHLFNNVCVPINVPYAITMLLVIVMTSFSGDQINTCDGDYIRAVTDQWQQFANMFHNYDNVILILYQFVLHNGHTFYCYSTGQKLWTFSLFLIQMKLDKVTVQMVNLV